MKPISRIRTLAKAHKRITTVLVIAAAAPFASACLEGNQNGQVVASTGDSITTLATNNINSDFAAGYQTNIQGENGETMGDALQEVKDEVADPNSTPAGETPAVMILELGTNDVLTQDANWQLELYYEYLAVQSVQCVIFVNISTYVDPNVPAGSVPQAEDINTALAGIASTNANMHVLDLNGAVHQGNNLNLYFDPNDFGSYVHETVAGEQWLADLEYEAVQQDCPSAPPAP